MNESLARKLLHDGGQAARLVEILHVMLPCWTELRQIRRAAADFVEERRRKLYTGLMGNGSQVKHGVRRASHAHIHRDGIFKGLARHDVTRLHIVFDEFHDDGARTFRQESARSRISRGNRAVARQPHAEDFRQTVHRVRRKKSSTGTAARTCLLFKLFHDTFVDESCGKFARRFKRLADADILSVEASREHRSAADDDRRNIQACRRHQHAGHDFVAVRNEHESVKARCHCHGLNGVGDKFAAGERILHSRMPHGNAVANTDGRKLQRRTASGSHTELRRRSNLTQVDMPGNHLIK